MVNFPKESSMPLYDDIIKEQKDIAREVSSLLQEIWDNARTSIEDEGSFSPLVASLIGDRITYYHPVWRSSYEKDKAFENINAEMEDYNVLATVAAYHGHFSGKTSLTKESSSIRAIILIARLASGQQVMVYPYRRDGEEVEWLPEVELEQYHSSITHPCVH
jgi:hypothetical protein